MKTEHLTDKQIQEQIDALEEENANTRRLSMGRGYGWGDGVMEKRSDKILHLNFIPMARRVEKKKTKPTPKKNGKYKIRSKPKEVGKLGEAVTKGVKKTNKVTKTKVKTKKKMNIPKDYEVQEVLGVFDIYFKNEYIGTRPTREEAIKYTKIHKDAQTKPKPKKKKKTKAKSPQRTLFGEL